MEDTARLLVKDVISVAPSESVLDVVRLMRDKHVGCVVVAEGGKIAGVFTERDVLNKVVPDGVDPAAAPVSRFMTPDPVTVDVSEPLEKVFEILARGRFRHVPVTEDGRPAGMVSLSDFAGVLGEVFSEDRYKEYFVSYWRLRAKGR